MTAWFTTATGDDLDDTLERATHLALIECCECHLPGLAGTAIALLPIQNVGDSERSTYHTGWAFMARYAQHMSSMFQEVTVTGAYQCLCLEEYDH
jgi:hypothetical protein